VIAEAEQPGALQDRADVEGRVGEHRAAGDVEPSGEQVQQVDRPLAEAAERLRRNAHAPVGDGGLRVREIERQAADRGGVDAGHASCGIRGERRDRCAHAVDAIERGMGMSVLEGSLNVEKPLLMGLMASPVSRHLVSLFLAGEEVKRKVGSVPDAMTRVGVLGAGLMGSQIAGQLAEKGYAVVLRDVAPNILAAAMGRILKGQTTQVRKKVIVPSELRYRLLRIAPTTTIRDVSPAPLVIEAVSEKLDVKRAVLADFESVAGSEAIFATNTSSYTLADIAVKAVHPERCVGLHFFNPPPVMKLLEVVRGEGECAV